MADAGLLGTDVTIGPIGEPGEPIPYGLNPSGRFVDETVDLAFENPGELPLVAEEDSRDLPFGSPRDPLNQDPGPPGPRGGRDDPVAPQIPGGNSSYAAIAILLIGVIALGQLFNVQVG